MGPITGQTPLAPGVPWPTVMLGESQLCERDGTVLARLTLEDGEGHVAADLDLDAPPAPLDPVRERFWIVEMSPMSSFAWHWMNAAGALSYSVRHRRRGFPWQALPFSDLPAAVGPAHAGAALESST